MINAKQHAKYTEICRLYKLKRVNYTLIQNKENGDLLDEFICLLRSCGSGFGAAFCYGKSVFSIIT